MKKFTFATILFSTLLIGGNVANANEISKISDIKSEIISVEKSKDLKVEELNNLHKEIKIKEKLTKNIFTPTITEKKENSNIVLSKDISKLTKEKEPEELVQELKKEIKEQTESVSKLSNDLDQVVEFDKKLDSINTEYSKDNKNEMTEKLGEVSTLISEISESDIVNEDDVKVTETLSMLSETKENLQKDIENHVSDKEKVVQTALGFIGVPYVWGGKSPEGMDCSGLTMLAYQSIGRDIAGYTVTQESAGQIISVGEAERGDLLFWGGVGASDHVAIALGDGTFVHAPQPLESVKITSISDFTPQFAVRVI